MCRPVCANRAMCGRMEAVGRLRCPGWASLAALDSAQEHSLVCAALFRPAAVGPGAADDRQASSSISRAGILRVSALAAACPSLPRDARAARQPLRRAAGRARRLDQAHQGRQDHLRRQVPQGLCAAEERRRAARQDRRGGQRLRHRSDAHRRRHRRRAHLQCRRLRPAADLLCQGRLLSEEPTSPSL